MTAAEILRSAEPPSDDGLIEKAIADLDLRIWEWADALKNAHSQLRGAFAARPAAEPISASVAATIVATTPGQRPSASLYEIAPSNPNLSAAAAAAHISSPPPMPAEWTAPPAAAGATDWAAAAAATQGRDPKWSTPGGHGASSGGNTSNWAGPAASASQGVQLSDSQEAGQGGVMSWPTTSAAGWPDSSGTSAPSSGPQAWPTWSPTDSSASASSSQAKKGGSSAPARSGKPAKAARPAVEGPSPEERAQKAAAEEALLSQLEDVIARRVRLLRRLDPDTPIEKLIDKAKQGQAETTSAASAKDDKSSWWRRK